MLRTGFIFLLNFFICFSAFSQQAAINTEIENSYEVLEAREEKLSEMVMSYKKDYSIRELLGKWHSFLDTLSIENYNYIKSSQLSSIRDPEILKNAQEFQKEFLHYYNQHQVLQAEVDKYTRDFYKTLSRELELTAKELMEQLPNNQKLQELKDSFTKYLNRYQYAISEEYGKQRRKDVRTNYFYSVLKETEKIVKMGEEIKRGPVVNLVHRLKEIISLIKKALPAFTSFAKILHSAMTQERAYNKKLNLTQNIRNLSQRLSQMWGIEIELEGEVHLSEDPNGKIVNVISPNHNNALLEVGLLHKVLPHDDFMIFAAGNEFIPDFLNWRKLFLDHPQFIYVYWKATSSVKESIRTLKQTGIRNILIYPEGNVSPALSETKAARAGFSPIFLKGLSKEGYDLRLTPVTYMNSDSRFVKNVFDLKADQKKIKIKIDKPIDISSMLGILKGSGVTDDFMNKLMRSVWIENLDTDINKIAGQWKISSFRRILREKGILKSRSNKSCSALLKAFLGEI